MITSIIVAACENNVIGKDNDLIWHLPVDMKFFKDKTAGHHVIMGRKNFESIPHKFRPLPNRVNIVVTRNKDYTAADCVVKNNLTEALEVSRTDNEKEAFIIGGGEIYKLALEQNLIDRIYLTRIHHKFQGDTFFPEIDEKKWRVVSKLFYEKDEKHKYDFTFLTYEKNT